MVQSYTFHKVETRWRLADWEQVGGQPVVTEASEKYLTNFMRNKHKLIQVVSTIISLAGQIRV